MLRPIVFWAELEGESSGRRIAPHALLAPFFSSSSGFALLPEVITEPDWADGAGEIETAAAAIPTILRFIPASIIWRRVSSQPSRESMSFRTSFRTKSLLDLTG